MEKMFYVLFILGIASFLIGCVSLVVIPLDGRIQNLMVTTTLAYAAPVLPAITLLSTAAGIYYFKKQPNNINFLASIVALSFWTFHLSIANGVVYCCIFITNKYFTTIGLCLLFGINLIVTIAIMVLSFYCSCQYYKILRNYPENVYVCTGWVRHHWAEENCCINDISYSRLGSWQIVIGIILSTAGMVGLFDEISILPMLTITTGSCIFTSGIMGIVTAKRDSPVGGIWFVSFSRISLFSSWLAITATIFFIVPASQYSRWGNAASLILLPLFAITSAAGLIISVIVEVMVGSRLGIHKYNPIGNGEIWTGYYAVLKTKEFLLALVLTIACIATFIVTFLAILLLNEAPFLLLSALTGCAFLASGQCIGNTLKRKNLMTESCSLMLCIICSSCIVANLILCIHQLHIWISIGEGSGKSPLFLVLSLVNSIISVLGLIVTVYGMYYIAGEVARLNNNTAESDPALDNSVQKELL